MKAFRIFFRNIRDGFKSVGRNISLSLASISCITITLLIVAVALVLSCNVENVTRLVKEDFTIVAFINTDAKEEDIDKLYSNIKAMKNVDTVTHQTKKEIAEDMKKDSKDLEKIIEMWTDETNPLYDTMLIKVKDTNSISKVADKIQEFDNIEDVKYGKGMVEDALTIFDVLEKIMLVVMVALLVVTLFLISNTIKITIYSRRTEIEIMRLVGASNTSIKQPFVIEGLCLGFLGAIIPIVATIYGYSALFKHFDGQMFSPFLKLVNAEPFVYIISLILLLIGIIVGMFGSYKAVRKYLKI